MGILPYGGDRGKANCRRAAGILTLVGASREAENQRVVSLPAMPGQVGLADVRGVPRVSDSFHRHVHMPKRVAVSGERV
jgi:hypothetical protein